MKVSFIYRRRQDSYFSIEKVFDQITNLIENKIEIAKTFVPYVGFTPRKIFLNLFSVRNLKADLFHVTGDIHYMTIVLSKKRTILTIHDCVFLHNTHGIKRWVLKQLLLDWPVRRCRLVTTISDKSRDEILRYTGCSAEKVIVIPNPVGPMFYHKEKRFDEQRPKILFIGSTANKNLDRVIRALEAIPCDLQIIGSFTETQRHLLQKANISFEQHSGLTEKALADMYAQCDLVLFPSLYEGFGLPVIEGQKSGRPVITSNISPMKDVAGEGACLVDPFNVDSIRAGLIRVISDEQYREEIVQNGLRNVKRYEPMAIAEGYLQLYKAVISGK